MENLTKKEPDSAKLQSEHVEPARAECGVADACEVRPEEKNSKKLKSPDAHIGKKVFLPVCILCLIVAVSLAFSSYLSKKNNEPEAEKVQISEFQKTLNEAIEAKSNSDSVKYVVDNTYYSESVSKDYIETLAMVSEQGVSSDFVASNLEKLFYQLPVGTGEIFLVQKDVATLIAESDNAIIMNILDYKFLGTENEKLTEQSKGCYISQNNPSFENIAYGTSNIRYSGCGPVSLTMAVNYLRGNNTVSLGDVVTWANEHNMYEQDAGTRWALFREYPYEVSLKCEEINITSGYEALNDILRPGEVMICSMAKGHFTENGHIILITEISDGKVSVLDPASIWRSLQKWDVSLIYEESNKHFWKISSQEPVSFPNG